MKDVILSQPFVLALALNNYDPLFGVNNINSMRRLDGDAYKQVAKFIETSARGSVIVLSGGEPFLDPRIKALISSARSNGCGISVDTWRGFEEQHSSYNQIQQIRLRLLSLNREKHDMLLGMNGSHKKAMAFGNWMLKNFAGEKILVFPICSENKNEMPKIVDWCRRIDFYPNMFIIPYKHRYALKLEDYPEVTTQLLALPLQNVIIDTPLLGLSGWPNLCSGGRLAMFIDVDGGVKPCPYFPYPLCHLDGDGVAKAWRCLQREVANLNASCSSCSQFASCGGGCLANKTESGKEYYCPYNEVGK
jgi:radical SAM protein with 4Fe4S-binding SPASM domain